MELRDLAEQILFANTLEGKLVGADVVTDEHPGPALAEAPAQPGRPVGLAFKESGLVPGGFPGVHRLEDAHERGRLLHFFCNHELLATELMALVLLRFPDAPPAFRRGVLQTLREEQQHTRWYLERMRACGQSFGGLPVSGYFWRAVSGMRSPMDFVAGLNLTFEQANLDFAQHYAAAFRAVGDAESAGLLGNIYRDEIAHVAHGLKWFRRWKDPALDDWSAYCRQLAFPLSPTRAKGPSLNVAGRRAAGLDPAFIAELDVAAQSKGRTPVVFWFNPLSEGFLHHGPGFTPSAPQAALVEDLATLPQFLARRDDVVLVSRRPSVEFLQGVKAAGFDLPEWVPMPGGSLPADHPLRSRKLGGLRPWAWGPDSARLLSPLAGQVPAGSPMATEACHPDVAELYSKAWSAGFLRRVLPRLDGSAWICPDEDVGVACTSWAAVAAAVAGIRARGHHRVVVKAAHGLAGQAAVRLWEPSLLPAQQRWIETALAGGRTVVVEPWLDRIVDFSVQLEMRPSGLRCLGYTGLVNDLRGQFLANQVGGDHGRRPPGPVAAAWREAGVPDAWGTRLYAGLWPWLEEELRARRFQGPLGVDAFLYRDGRGGVRLKPVVEVNPRYTMGRLALELMGRVAPGVPGEFRLVNRSHLRAGGHATFVELSRDWRGRHPVRRAGEPVPRLRDGVVFLTDPEAATQVVAVLAVGDARAVFDAAPGGAAQAE